MNRKIVTILLSAVTGSVMADQLPIDPMPSISAKSRAEVREELERFRRAGVNPWSKQYDQLKNFRSSRTSAEVTADYVGSRSEVAALTSEDSGSMYLTRERRESGRTRAEVTAEYIRARDEVAAITSEDSGSMYLTHMGGRARNARLLAGRIGRDVK